MNSAGFFSAMSIRWFISIQTEREMESPVHPSTSELGIDVGIAN
jgi:transposase